MIGIYLGIEPKGYVKFWCLLVCCEHFVHSELDSYISKHSWEEYYLQLFNDSK